MGWTDKQAQKAAVGVLLWEGKLVPFLTGGTYRSLWTRERCKLARACCWFLVLFEPRRKCPKTKIIV